MSMSDPVGGGLQPPPDPTNEIVNAMVTMHVMFVGAVEAGFSEYQACVMLGSYMAGIGQGGNGRTE